MRKLLLPILLALALAAGTAPAFAAKDVTIAVPDNLTGLDPTDVNDTLSQSAARMMFQGLYGFDKDMKLIPVLAESYESNAIATEFTFHLRRGVTFHDGTPFDAQAVKVNFERLADPKLHLKRRVLLSMLDHVEVIDDHTVKLVLNSPFGALVNSIAHPGAMILSPKAIAEYGRDIGRHPVGTGPYVFVSWNADTLKVARNPHYWKPDVPKVDTITFRSVPENGTRIAMLQAGEAQFIYPVPPEMVAVVSRNPDLTVIDAPSIIVRYVAMNTRKKPFGDVRVRQALNYAIDKEAFARVVYSGFSEKMDAPLPEHLQFYARQGDWPYDPAKARALLAEAGYKDGFETTMWSANNTLAIRAMQFLQQQLGAVGVKVAVEPLEAGVLDARVWTVDKPEDATMQMMYTGWSSSTGDADWGMRPLLYSKSFPPVLFNIAYYDNASVDRDIEAALATADSARRGEAYAAAQAQIWGDAPWIFLGVERILAAQTKTLHGVYRIPDGGLLTEDAALD